MGSIFMDLGLKEFLRDKDFSIQAEIIELEEKFMIARVENDFVIFVNEEKYLGPMTMAVEDIDDFRTIKIKEGDTVLGLPSSGIHSNGFSLVRKIIHDRTNYDSYSNIEELGKRLGEELLTPTRIYTKPVLELTRKFDIKGIAHITGGGLYENIPRIMPEGLTAEINLNKVKLPKIFTLLQEWGKVGSKEMYSTFNMGVGIVFVVSKEETKEVINYLQSIDEEVYELGEIIKGDEGAHLCH